MNYPTRIYYTEADKSLMWDRWQKGESLNAIGRHFGRSLSSIQNIFATTGGIRPPPRKRSRLTLTMAERFAQNREHHLLEKYLPALYRQS